MTAQRVGIVLCAALLGSACGRRAPAGDTRPVPASAGAASHPPLSRTPACSLMSREEIAEILEAPIGKPRGEDTDRSSECSYPPGPGGSFAQATIKIVWQDASGPSVERQLAGALGNSEPARRVARSLDLGDEATYSNGVLDLRTGEARITVNLPPRPDSEDKAILIGRALLGKLGRPVTRSEQRADARSDASTGPSVDTVLKSLGSLFDSIAKDTPSMGDLKLPEGVSAGGRCPEPGPDPDEDIKAQAAARIPIKVGLTLVSFWKPRAEAGERECLKQVTAVDARTVTVTESCPEVTAGGLTVTHDGEVRQHTRRICRADLRSAHAYYTQFADFLPETLPGTTVFTLSQQAFDDLKRRGSTEHRYMQIDRRKKPTDSLFLKYDSAGTLTLAEAVGRAADGARSPATAEVLVNGAKVALPVLNVAGTVRNAGGADSPDEVRVQVLDDPRVPLVLEYEHVALHFSIRYAKISFPTDGTLERDLERNKRAEVYGIYFDFASDRLRPESTPVLREIADVLGRNPSWHLSINGHTDNVGGDAFNMDLSKRRSEAVRRELVDRYRIEPSRLTTGGFGASQPKETNDTPAGRARNRRVELVRQ